MMHQCPIGIKLLCLSGKANFWVFWHDVGTLAVILRRAQGREEPSLQSWHAT